MESREFAQMRHYLGKTQNQMALLLCVSPKSVQSFEQGWRNVPASVERQLLFLLFLKRDSISADKQCWEIRDCPAEWREKCAAWEFQAGHYCWFINGTFCRGRFEHTWKKKLEICRSCQVFLSTVPFPASPSPDQFQTLSLGGTSGKALMCRSHETPVRPSG